MSESHELGPPGRPPVNRPNRAETLAYLALAVSVLAVFLTLILGLRDSDPAQHVPSGGQTALDQLSETSARVVESAIQSVVRVEVSFRSPRPITDDLETYFGSMPREQLGSGVVVESMGFVLTNYHVVRGADIISLIGFDGRKHVATLVGHDPLTDLAVLQVPDLNLPALSWADSDRAVVGNLVWAIGNPHGLDQSVSMGVVSSTNRPNMLDSPFQDFIQTDASVNPGNSGGALIDSRGNLIGINTAITGESFSGISFALPSNSAKRVFGHLREHGKMPRGWIGLQLGSMTPARSAVASLDRPFGAYVESLVSGKLSPARTAGIRVADICTHFEGQPVSGPLGLIRKIANHPIGTAATLRLLRDGTMIDVEVIVSQRP